MYMILCYIIYIYIYTSTYISLYICIYICNTSPPQGVGTESEGSEGQNSKKDSHSK